MDMSGRNVIVTGASPGSLGFKTAGILAGWGATITVTSPRNVELMLDSLRTSLRRAGMDESKLSAHSLDLCDPSSVNRFTDWYGRRHNGKLHALVNNAGIHKNIFNTRTRPPPSADGFEPHWRTNFLGTVHLTYALLPMLQRTGLDSGGARIVNVSSHLHDRGRNARLFQPADRYHSWEAYGLSKLALMHFTTELQRRFAGQYNLQAVAVHPGSAKTNLTQGRPLPGRTGKILSEISSALSSLVLLSAEAGAQTIVMCASAPRLQGGGYYYRCAQLEPSADCEDAAVSRRLWGQSRAWVESLPASEP